MKTLGLSCIVKNEIKVIGRMLESVAGIVDHYTVVDTGSTDGTQDFVRKFFAERGIPGEVVEIPWVDFSHARNVALRAAEKHTDWCIWVDADEVLVSQGFDKQRTLNLVYQGREFDSFTVKTVFGRAEYLRKNLWNARSGFEWRGPVHELLTMPEATKEITTVALGLSVLVRSDGSSWDVGRIEKYTKHAAIFEEFCKTDKDPRWMYYAGQSYRDSEQFEMAVYWYRKRAECPDGYKEEVYSSLFNIAQITCQGMKRDIRDCITLYLDAHKADPLRGEPINWLVKMLLKIEDFENAYIFSLYGLRYTGKNPYPTRTLFLEKHTYDFENQSLHIATCMKTSRYEEANKTYWVLRSIMEKLDTTSDEELRLYKENILSQEKFFPRQKADTLIEFMKR